MTFVHDDRDFPQLLRIVARETGIGAALVEKDYWVTHCLWALHRTGLEIWFKGGTSLSKGFGLIERFSEDLDLMIERGAVESLPLVTSWTSMHQGRVAQRRAFYDALTDAFAIPGVPVSLDAARHDKYARTADYLGHYPGALVSDLPGAMSPFVRFEVGPARVVPFVEMALTSFVHAYLERQGMLVDYLDNRPSSVRCVHPLVTLLEKLDAMARRYGREQVEADSFVRHYEDAARIVRALRRLPSTEMGALELAEDMLAQRDIAALPGADDPSLVLDAPDKRERVMRAYAKIGPMFWGPRIPLEEASAAIRAWIRQLAE